MTKTIKTIGIGAAVLMICLAVAPAVYGAPSATLEKQTVQVLNVKETEIPQEVLDAVNKFAVEHPEQFKELSMVIAQYIEEHGSIVGLEQTPEFKTSINGLLDSTQQNGIGGELPPMMLPRWLKWLIIGLCVTAMIILWL